MEVYVLVEKQRSFIGKMCEIVSLVLGVLSLILMLVGEIVFFLAAVLFFLLVWFFHTERYEYEYSYFAGEFRFAKIRNKSRRKELKGYTADEVIQIAPIGDRAVYQYLNNSKLKQLDYTSGASDAKVYAMVVKGDAEVRVIKYEPDDKYLDAVCEKYRQKVIR